MSEFNKVTIGNSPYDQRSLIAGLEKDIENGHFGSKGCGRTIKMELDGDTFKTVVVSGETNMPETKDGE